MVAAVAVAAVAAATEHSITRFHPMMPGSSSLLLFVSAAVVLLVIPGPAVLYVTSRSIGQGRSAGFVSALGIGAGTLVHAAAAAVGLSALLMSSAIAFSAVKYLGAAYLIYLGIQKLRREESLEPSQGASRTKLSRVFGQGIIVNILNPKTALFFFAFLPQFVDASRGNVALQILFLVAPRAKREARKSRAICVTLRLMRVGPSNRLAGVGLKSPSAAAF